MDSSVQAEDHTESTGGEHGCAHNDCSASLILPDSISVRKQPDPTPEGLIQSSESRDKIIRNKPHAPLSGGVHFEDIKCVRYCRRGVRAW